MQVHEMHVQYALWNTVQVRVVVNPLRAMNDLNVKHAFGLCIVIRQFRSVVPREKDSVHVRMSRI